MQPTKIFHIISSLNRGGRERQLLTIWKHSNNTEIINNIFCLTKPSVKDSYQIEYHLSDRDIIFSESDGYFTSIKSFRKLIRKENPDILYTWGNKETVIAEIASIGLNKKLINGSIRHGVFDGTFHQQIRRIILHFSRYIVANSKAGLKANGLKRGFILYNGVDEKLFCSNSSPKEKLRLRQSLSLPLEKYISISIANLVAYKDHFTVIQALKKLVVNHPSILHIIIGEGVMRDQVLAEISKAGLKDTVLLLGRKQNIKEYLVTSDLFIHSSRGEGCSNAILEAMASGLPVIATNTGGTNEIVDETVGILFEFKNVDQLTDGLVELLNDKEKAKNLGSNARLKVMNNFTITKMMDKYYSILHQVLAK